MAPRSLAVSPHCSKFCGLLRKPELYQNVCWSLNAKISTFPTNKHDMNSRPQPNINSNNPFFNSLRERIPIEVNMKSDPQKLIETNIRKCDLACVRLAASLTILWIQLLLSVHTIAGILMAQTAQWFQMDQNTPKISLLDVIKQFFPNNFTPIHWISISGHLIALPIKNLSNCSGNFTNFWNTILGGFLPFGPTVGRPGRPQFLKQPNDP